MSSPYTRNITHWTFSGISLRVSVGDRRVPVPCQCVVEERGLPAGETL